MTDQKERLSKVIAGAGITSRRKAEELIFKGKVTVNGELVIVPQTLVSAQDDTIVVDGLSLPKHVERVYLILNKPRGYICSSKRMGSKKIVLDLFKDYPHRLFTIGRLDRDTTGLLLLTNDGAFAQEVIHPSKGVLKEYVIKVAQEVEHDHLVTIAKGALVEGVWVKPAKVTKVRRGTLKIVVREGKKREVRILVQKAGLTIESLHRVRIGNLALGPLEEGEWRELTEDEKNLLLTSPPFRKKSTRSR